MGLKLKLISEDEKEEKYRYAYIEWAVPEGAKTVVATEKGMLRRFKDESEYESSEDR
jgi:hypothetical protein